MAEKGVSLQTEPVEADVEGMGQPLGQEPLSILHRNLVGDSQLIAGDSQWPDKGIGAPTVVEGRGLVQGLDSG